MFENVRQALQGIWSHKMRSFLTMLGIIIGIAAIIAIVSTIKGTNEEIKRNLIGSGNNTVDVKLSAGGYEFTISDYSGIPAGLHQVADETLAQILDLEEVEAVTSYNERIVSEGMYYQNTAISDLKVYGVDDAFFTTCNYIVKTGRGFLSSDYEAYRKVLIADERACATLFGDGNPLGKTVEISRQPFTVVGIVTERKKQDLQINSVEDYWTYADDSNGFLFMPKSTWPVVFGFDEPENITVKAVSTDAMTQAGKKTANLLNDTLQNTDDGSGSKIKYMADDILGRASQLQSLSNSTNILLVLVAGISLLVGGIGVMNIMLVSVTERTSEIGLKKAIGAKKGVILGQFLTEAAVLTSLGGLLGVACGVGAAYTIHHFAGIAVAIDIPASVVAVAFSMVIGILFGFLPSVQASNLDPIEALRRE